MNRFKNLYCFPKQCNRYSLKQIINLATLTGFLMLFSSQTFGQAFCTLTCNDELNVAIDNTTCQTKILYDAVLEDPDNPRTCSPNGRWSYTIDVMEVPNGTPIPTSPFITGEYIGRTLYVKAKHWSTGNFCLTKINIIDLAAPQMSCPADVTVSCTAATDPDLTGRPTVSDCSGFDISYTDAFDDFDCGDPIGRIVRTWRAVDGLGNVNTCTQIINIAKPNINEVVFPPNLDDIEADALSCIDPDVTPENTGFPSINGVEISENNNPCKIGITYEDDQIQNCDGTYKIIRDWRIVDWCGSLVRDYTQIIKIKDDIDPVLDCPANFVVGSDGSRDCTADVVLPRVNVSDGCSNTINVQITSQFGTINGNGGVLNNVPIGTHFVTYTATDGCGNLSNCTVEVTVRDNTPPIVICDEFTTINLTNNGTATVPATIFDDGSFDNCRIAKVEVRRMEDPVSAFAPDITFNCEDAGTEVQVVLRVTDNSGNENGCMVIASISDKIPASITCPAEVTLDCADDITDLTLTGEPVGEDACGVVNATFEDESFLNDCNIGFVLRTWMVGDTQGNNPVSCTQRINLIDNTPLTVNFPPDYTTSNCSTAEELEPDDLPAPFDRPTFENDDCEMVAVNFEDEIFQISPPACFKILRRWKVINWCVYDVDNPDGPGQFTHLQTIKVLDNDAPTFSCPDDILVEIRDQTCTAEVRLPRPTDIVDCSANTSITVSGDLGSGFRHQNVAPGIYNVTYTVFDGCGNSSDCSFKVTVRDAAAPTAYCLNGLSIALMENGRVQIWASDFNRESLDNCTAPEDIKLRIENTSEGGVSETAPDSTGITFTCDQQGSQTIAIWVGDDAGNWAICETFIIVQDTRNVCGNLVVPATAMVAGLIQDERGEIVEDVSIHISGTDLPNLTTGFDGQFEFRELQTGQDYTISPQKVTNAKNGVSTFDQVLLIKHILGVQPLVSPYKMIAADVDRSGTLTTADAVEMRRMILAYTTEFSNNTSWRFVDANYQFENQNNPFNESIPEVYNVNNLVGDMMEVNFMAIKIGDINGNAINSNLTEEGDERNENDALLISVNDKVFAANESVSIDFRASDFNQILGYQLALNFDTEVLEFENADAAAELDALFNEIDGQILTNFAKANGLNFEEDAVLFTLHFKTKQAGKVSEVIRIDETRMQAEAYSEVLDLLDLQLDFKSSVGAEVILYQNVPNPFDKSTQIGFSLPAASATSLSVYDVTGKLLYLQTGNYAAGYHEIRLTKDELGASGTLYYRLETAGQTFARKLIVF